MKKKTLALMLGCMLALCACSGKGNDEAAAQPETPAAEEPAPENTEPETIEPLEEEPLDEDDGFIDESEMYGEEVAPDENGKISNGFMSITMPKELEGTYVAYVMDSEIDIYDKDAKEDGFGGFVFGVAVADNYEMYGGMRMKIGELTTVDNQVLHVLYYGPSEVQWNYDETEDMPASYKALYDKGRDIAATLEPVQGGSYADGAGTKGEEIYADVVKDLKEKIANAKDANELEEAELSPEYYAITQGKDGKDPMTAIGVAYLDFNLDGVDEMVVGDIESGDLYDIFASVDGKGTHVVSGTSRDSYFVNGSSLVEHVLESAGVDVKYYSELLPNSIEIFPQFAMKIDETAEEQYSICYDLDADEWDPMTEEAFNERLELMQQPTKVELIPLGELK